MVPHSPGEPSGPPFHVGSSKGVVTGDQRSLKQGRISVVLEPEQNGEDGPPRGFVGARPLNARYSGCTNDAGQQALDQSMLPIKGWERS